MPNKQEYAIIREEFSFTLGALAAGDLVGSAGAIGTNLAEDFRITKSEIFVNPEFTADGEGAVLFGLADGDLSDAEIEECLEADGPQDSNDRIGKEKAERPVYPILMFPTQQAASGVPKHTDGKPVEWKKRWTFQNGKGWRWWAYNLDQSAALTTGSLIRVFATHYGVWVR